MAEKLIILDTTLRDGEQTPGVNLNLAEKLTIARQLARLGVDVIEAGFAASSPGDFKCVQSVAQGVSGVSVCSLARCVPGDIQAAADALKDAAFPRIHVFIATSPIHMQYKLRMKPEDVIERAVESVRMARNLCPDVEFSPEDGARTEPEFLYRVLEAVIKAGATTINFPDTIGYATTEGFAQQVRGIVNNVPNIGKAVLSVHCHDDLGLAVANSLAAVSAGARQVECTVNGLGERAGNASLEEIAMGIHTRRDAYPAMHGLSTRQLYRTSRLVESLTGIDIAPNKAVVGQNAFAHESGIHQHGMLANRETYEVMRPEDVGVPSSTMVLGKLSGRHAFAERIAELGYSLSEQDLNDAFAKFKDLCDKKKEVTDRDIAALLGENAMEVPEVYTLASYQILTGNQVTTTATVTLTRENETFLEAATGDGPVNAAYRAIDKAVGLNLTLESYVIKAVTEGADALGEVTVRVRENGDSATGKGVSTDILEASILAYTAAVNRLVATVKS